MSLAPGTRIGPYEILSMLGAGGMGEVYRARDTRLDRSVAVKILPESFATDPERLARFEREAKTLASLNHPGIAHVYGLEDGAQPLGQRTRSLVMELIEGEDLSARIERGPLPIAEVVAIARQIADAIGTAHDAGIVHRDLKPSNIRVRPDGVVKVLDFGLAKQREARADAGAAPTITEITVGSAVVMGTAAYMSPEQARGQAVDMRSDIWAFGCVVYEMLTGRRAFSGPTTSDTIAKILEREPDWVALPPSTPPGLRRLLDRCLVKEPKRRLHAFPDAQFDLDAAVGAEADSAGLGPSAPPRHFGRHLLVAGPIAAALLLIAGLWYGRRAEPVTPPRVLSLTTYPGVEAVASFSPDAKQVAFSWDGEQLDNEDIYVVLVGSDLPHRVTTNPERDVSPAWKPDGSQIAFARLYDRSTAIYVASALGGSEQKLTEFRVSRTYTAVRGTADPLLSWSPDGRWLVVSGVTIEENSPLYLVAHDGSERHTLLPASPTNNYTAAAFSPQGTVLAYADSGYIGVVDIDPEVPTNLKKAPRRVTEFQGYIAGLAWTGDSKEVLYGRAPYAAPAAPFLWRVTVDGSSAPRRIDLAGVASFPSMSASGRLAFGRRELNVDMRVLRAGGEPTNVAASTFNEFDASFSPDGSKIAFASDRTGEGNEIWIVNSDGTGRRQVTRGARRPEGSPRWSPDGKQLAFDGLGDDGVRHVYIVDEAGGAIRAVPEKRGSFDQLPSWSRDGKWVYFGSDRSGTSDVWRTRLDGGEPQQVTRNGGAGPFESWNGRTLYFSKPTKGGRTLFAKPLDGGPERALGIDVTFWNYAVGPRGLYYTTIAEGRRAPYSYDIRLLDDSGRTTLIHRVQQATMSPGLSVTSDGQSVLIAGLAEMRQDLFLIENFR